MEPSETNDKRTLFNYESTVLILLLLHLLYMKTTPVYLDCDPTVTGSWRSQTAGLSRGSLACWGKKHAQWMVMLEMEIPTCDGKTIRFWIPKFEMLGTLRGAVLWAQCALRRAAPQHFWVAWKKIWCFLPLEPYKKGWICSYSFGMTLQDNPAIDHPIEQVVAAKRSA